MLPREEGVGRIHRQLPRSRLLPVGVPLDLHEPLQLAVRVRRDEDLLGGVLDALRLRQDPSLDLLGGTVQEGQLVLREDPRQQVDPDGDAEQDHHREGDRDRLEALHGVQHREEEELDGGEEVDAPERLDVLRVGRRVLDPRGFLEEEEDPLPQLLGRERHQPHEQEDAVEDGDRDELDDVQGEARSEDHDVRQQPRQPGLLEARGDALLRPLRHRRDVHDAGDRRGDEPRQTEDRVDGDHDSGHERVVVVRVPVRDPVGRVVDDVPRDAVVEEAQDEGQRRGPGRSEDDPGLPAEIEEVDDPRPPA
mmetsp:Transcript_14681/g.34111  ORF Transcript_14681/g.34111 Transcript_14681/m.34111 type:complete len:307 (-) Transcript_14681:289-1209(-)